jgi:hypothetical protein
MVFASGSIYWALALDSYRELVDKACANQDPLIPGIQKLMARIMSELVINHRSH